MNLEYRKNNDITDPQGFDYIVHQCNLHHIMGAGVAKALADKFPQVYEADLATEADSVCKLSSYSIAETPIGKVVNMYSQVDGKTDYEALFLGLNKLRAHIISSLSGGATITIGFPYLIGCGIAGGNKRLVHVIIKEIFSSDYVDEDGIVKFNIVYCNINDLSADIDLT